jgi:hypothetical protein
MAAAAALAPYAHPKLQALPTPRFIDNPIDVPDFTSVEIAEDFLARLPVLVARGELDFQSAQELSAMTKLWIDAKNDRSELELKVVNQGGETEQTIHITGGLPELPGTRIEMPLLNGHATNGHALAPPWLAEGDPPAPAVPQIDTPSGPKAEPGEAT